MFKNAAIRALRKALDCAVKDNHGVGMINATKETYHLLMRILTIVSHFELYNGCQVERCVII